MTRRAAAFSALVAAMLQTGCAGDDGGGPSCSRAELQGALDSAGSGDTVRIGACRVDGSLRVPAGVTLVGEGVDESIVAGTEAATVWLEPGDPPATLQHVTIESSGVAGIAGGGEADCASRALGRIVVSDVVVRATAGWGVYVRCVEGVEIVRTEVFGPIDDASFESMIFNQVVGEVPPAGAECSESDAATCTVGETRETTPSDCPSCGVVTQVCDPCGRWATLTAREGIALREVGSAQLTAVRVADFAVMGVSAVDSGLTWTGGETSGNLGVGLYASGSTVELDGIATRDNRQSSWRADLTIGAFFGSGSTVVTTDLSVERNAGFGILDADSSASHRGLRVEDNVDTGIWVGNSSSFELDGGDVLGNAFAGIVLSSSANVQIRNTTIADTRVRESAHVSGVETAPIMVGDGLHLRDTTAGLLLEVVTLVGNHRAGMVFDLGTMGTPPDATFVDVTASADGAALGAIAGYREMAAPGAITELAPVPPGGWDEGITREGAAIDNDPAWMERLAIVGIVIPIDLPRPEEIAGIVIPID